MASGEIVPICECCRGTLFTMRTRQYGVYMIPFSDFRQHLVCAAQYGSADQFISDSICSMPTDDSGTAARVLSAVWAMAHDGLTIKSISAACGISVRQIGIRYGIPQRTLENWSSCVASPPSWQLPFIAYAVVSDFLTNTATGIDRR